MVMPLHVGGCGRPRLGLVIGSLWLNADDGYYTILLSTGTTLNEVVDLISKYIGRLVHVSM